MPIRRSLPLALVAVLSASLTSSASVKTTTAAVPQSAESARAQTQTVRDMRVLATALFAWLTDNFDADNHAPLDAPGEGRPCVAMKANTGPCEIVDVEKLPLISHEELTRLLVPDYLAAVPEKDGWGNPFEVRLDRQHLNNRSVIAIRSAGSDGMFSGSRYERGTFSPIETSQDLVWMDGFFIRWPEGPDAKDTH